MARNYSIDGRDTNTAATTILGLTSAATIRPKIYFVQVGSYGTPADYAAEYQIGAYTAAGTSTAVVPYNLSAGGPAALASAGEAHSVEPTYTAAAILLILPAHNRETIQFYAGPGRELELPATAANGAGLYAVNVSTAWTANCVIHYEE